MNWIANYVRPKIRGLMKSRDVPDNLWDKCPACSQMIFARELEKNLRVCTHCDHHLRLGVKQRLELLFDEGKYTKVELPKSVTDPLKFRDRKRYSDRLKEAQAKAGGQDAIQVAHGTVGGHPTVVACFDFSFMGGSMGIAVGEGLLAAAKLAVLQEAALIAVPASGGARMQEGILSLMQMPRSVIAVDMVKDAGLPYIVLLTDPTTGGVSASFAMLGDIAISEPGAIIGFAGRRVIEETIREQLPSDFQTAEYLLDHGMVDMVVDRRELHDRLAGVIDLLRRPGPAAQILDMEKKREEKAAKPEKKPKPEKAPATTSPEDAARANEGGDGADSDSDK